VDDEIEAAAWEMLSGRLAAREVQCAWAVRVLVDESVVATTVVWRMVLVFVTVVTLGYLSDMHGNGRLRWNGCTYG
jgi:hypothetical protein